MKVCNVCNISKDENEFFFRNRKKNIRHNHCKSCKKDIDREYYKKSSIRREKIRRAAKEKSAWSRAFIKRVKKRSHCTKCGDNRWYVLDFHHIKGKGINISMIAGNSVSIKKVKNEMRKCEILCSNCHREAHYLKRSEANLVKAPG